MPRLTFSVSMLRKYKNYLKVIKRFLGLSFKPHKENIALKIKFSNYKECYILGSSPSINKFNLKELLANDVMKITMSNFHEHPDINDINPNVHIFAASHSPITQKVLRKWWGRCESLLPKDTILLVEKGDLLIAKEVFKTRELYAYSYNGQFPIDFTKPIMSARSVAQIAMQLAIYVEIKNVNFLGINHDWRRIEPYSHFYDHSKPSLEYYLKQENIKIHYEELEGRDLPKEFLYSDYELYKSYEKIREYAESKGVNIYNVDTFSSFDVFSKKKLTSC